MQALLLETVILKKQMLTKVLPIAKKSLGYNNLSKLIFAYLHLNSIRNKFEFLSEQVKGNIDVLMVSEAKHRRQFSIGNFFIHDFSLPYRLDLDSNSGGIMY